MDITKLLPLLLAAKGGGGDQNNLSQLLPELIKAQSLGGEDNGQNALTGMLLNMLTSNFNKQNASCDSAKNAQANAQSKQTDMAQSELKTTDTPTTPNNYASIKNYKNFYAPPESSPMQIASAKSDQSNNSSCEQCAKNVYPSDIKPAKNKNSANNDAMNIKTPFGYTRLY